MPKLLALLSNPDNTVKIRMDKELKEILRCISPTVIHDFNCRQVPAIRIQELPGLIINEKPDLLHFSGHGNESRLSFEDADGISKDIDVEALRRIFKETGKYIKCLFLNACNSSSIASVVKDFIPYIIAFPQEIDDEHASTFAITFYETLSLGHTIESSFELASAVIFSDVPKKGLPEIFINDKLLNYTPIIFKTAVLKAHFQLDEDGDLEENDNCYHIKIYTDNVPQTASYVIYEFIDGSISEEDSINKIEDISSGNYNEFWLSGNIVIRVWLWMGERKYGIGMEATLYDCLNNYYQGKVPPKCRKAYKQIRDN